MSNVRPWSALLLALAALCAPGRGGSAAAQQPDTVVVITPTTPAPTQEDVELPDIERPATPGGAFLRAMLVPGWGHASIGAYTRGGFYFAAESTTGFLLARTFRRLALAKDARDLEEDAVRATLPAGASADSVAAVLDADPEVARARRLVNSRRQQLEDWVALGVFLVFLGGADAFVSAHLRDFPEPIAVEALTAPGGLPVGIGLKVSLPVGPPSRDR